MDGHVLGAKVVFVGLGPTKEIEVREAPLDGILYGQGLEHQADTQMSVGKPLAAVIQEPTAVMIEGKHGGDSLILTCCAALFQALLRA